MGVTHHALPSDRAGRRGYSTNEAEDIRAHRVTCQREQQKAVLVAGS